MKLSQSNSVLRRNLDRFDELFYDFHDSEIDAVDSMIHPVSLRPEQYLFYEGTNSDNLYLLLEGQVRIEKNGQLLTSLDHGNYFGELSILDGQPHSASVYATSASKLLAVNVTKLKEAEPQAYSKLIINLAKSLPEMVRKSSETATASLTNEMTLLKQQNDMGHFLTYIMAVLAIFIIVAGYIEELDGTVHDATYVRLTLVLSFVVCLLAIKNKQSFSRLGLNLNNPSLGLIQAMWYSIAVMIIALVAKMIWIKLNPEANAPLFKIKQHHTSAELVALLAYCIYSPLQEFVARGCLQSAFAQFFKDRFATTRAVILSNLLFCSFYANLSLKFALLLFTLGLGWGWLYSRSSSLLGVAISHAFLAIWIGGILGLPIELR